MSTAKLVSLILLVTFVAMSFVPYGEKNNPKTPPSQTLQAPKEVMEIFKKACFDCHSNETKWPWYSSVFPLSWSIKDHVKNGRRSLNFSIWNTYSQEKQQELKESIYRKAGTIMPLAEYILFHPEAKLTKEEIKKVKNWAE